MNPNVAVTPIVLKTGSTVRSLRERGEDFEHWIAHRLDRPIDRLRVIDCQENPEYPNPSSADAVIVTGSPSSVHHHEEWSERAGEWLTEAIASGVPILGICYGHQLIAHALGGVSKPNPRGREIGVARVRALQDDPLFAELPDEFTVIETHSDAVLQAPETSIHLATNENSEFQALGYGENVRTVQWHPEFSAEIIKEYIRERAQVIDAETSEGRAQTLLGLVQEVPSGSQIMRNFMDHFVRS